MTLRPMDRLLDREKLSEKLASFPRVRLASLPTPLEEAPRLREALGPDAPRILVKRDDLTGFAFGGNKARHVELRLPDIQAQKADTLVVANPAQSNNARTHAALGAKFGLETYILKVPGPKIDLFNGNLLLDRLYGAIIVEAKSDDHRVARTKEADELVLELSNRGRTVYRVGGSPFSSAASTLAYMLAALELGVQLDAEEIGADHIFMAGSTSASGVALAGKVLGESYRVHPVSVRDTQPGHAESICDAGNLAAEFLQLDAKLDSSDFTPHDEYIGSAWGVPTEGCMEALLLAARTEGLVLDPVFTAKAMHALIDHIRTGRISRNETVVFFHTGGQPINFAYSDEIRQSLDHL